MPEATPMITCEQVQRTFQSASGIVHGLRDLNLQVNRGEFVAVHGPSGSGKSTLLLTLGGMLRPSSGRVLLGDQDLYGLTPAARNRLRATAIGFVFPIVSSRSLPHRSRQHPRRFALHLGSEITPACRRADRGTRINASRPPFSRNPERW